MAAEESSAVDDARMKITCSHGGHLLPCGPDGALRYVGGETRVLVLPRSASFRDLAARLSEMAGGAQVRAIMHRLADEGLEDVIVSVTCDEELVHMRDEYDRLRTTRPAARFRVFVATTSGGDVQRRRAEASGLPPVAPRMRRVQSEQAIAGWGQLHRRPAHPAPMRRAQSAQELRVQRFFHHRVHQSRCVYQGQEARAPTAATPAARPMCALPYMSKNVNAVSVAEKEATARSRDAKSTMDFDKGRAIWEFDDSQVRVRKQIGIHDFVTRDQEVFLMTMKEFPQQFAPADFVFHEPR
ncbi:hypothetical protein EJB05_05096, partial [Eragrostis curvula]